MDTTSEQDRALMRTQVRFLLAFMLAIPFGIVFGGYKSSAIQWNSNESIIMDTVHASNREDNLRKQLPGVKIRKKEHPQLGPYFMVTGPVPKDKAAYLADWLAESGGELRGYHSFIKKQDNNLLPLGFQKFNFLMNFPILVRQDEAGEVGLRALEDHLEAH